MSNFKGTPANKIMGKSNYSTVNPTFKPTFWANGTKPANGNAVNSDGAFMKKGKMGGKMGKCPNCG